MRRKGRRRAPVRLEAQPAVNARWSVNFMSDALPRGRRFRAFNALDDFSREAPAAEVDANLPAARVIRVPDRIAAWRGYPTKMCMDNGPEFVSAQPAGWAEQRGVELEFIQPGKPAQNSYVERFNRTFREEEISNSMFSVGWARFALSWTHGRKNTMNKDPMNRWAISHQRSLLPNMPGTPVWTCTNKGALQGDMNNSKG